MEQLLSKLLASDSDSRTKIREPHFSCTFALFRRLFLATTSLVYAVGLLRPGAPPLTYSSHLAFQFRGFAPAVARPGLLPPDHPKSGQFTTATGNSYLSFLDSEPYLLLRQLDL